MQSNVQIINSHNYKDSGENVRVRDIGQWTLLYGKDDQGTWISVAGIVLRGENERPMAPGANLRYTTSSPIIKVEGRVVFTESGSKYTLVGDPNPMYLILLEAQGLKYDTENPIPISLIAGE